MKRFIKFKNEDEFNIYVDNLIQKYSFTETSSLHLVSTKVGNSIILDKYLSSLRN